jgi:chemotaxis signal transduction protein
MKVITFSIGAQPCAMAVDQLVEIVPAGAVLPLPSVEAVGNDAAIVGITDYRGRAIPVIRLDFRALSDDHPGPAAPSSPGRRRFLVLGGASPTALEISRVDAVVELNEQSIQPPGDVGLQGHPMIGGVCRLNDVYAFVINGQALNGGRCMNQPSGAATGAFNG